MKPKIPNIDIPPRIPISIRRGLSFDFLLRSFALRIVSM